MDTKNEKLKKVRAYPNIALIKYWGKFDNENHLPYNSSLSISVDTIYTETESEIIEGKNDIFYLNDVLQSGKESEKMISYLNKVRKLYNLDKKLKIKTKNFFPTAAGLASSASGYAALAKSIDIAYNLNLDDSSLSKLARIGSVSAARSIYGDFVYLEKKSEEAKYFANADDYSVIFIIINSEKKEISSRLAMKNTVETSSYYKAWLDNTKIEFEEMKKAILYKDFTKIGLLTESSCLKMHATMLASNPPFTYLKGKTLETIDLIRKIRKDGFEAYFTIDAGSNVKVLCKRSEVNKIYQLLKNNFDEKDLILCNTSKGYEVIKGE